MCIRDSNRGPGDDIKRIIKSIDKFVGDAPQFDDITCVVLHYQGTSEHMHTSNGRSSSMDGKEVEVNLTLTCDLSEIPRVAEEIERLGESNNWPTAWVFNANLALDELITNIISYAFKRDDESTDISLSLNQSNKSLRIVLEDLSLIHI